MSTVLIVIYINHETYSYVIITVTFNLLKSSDIIEIELKVASLSHQLLFASIT